MQGRPPWQGDGDEDDSGLAKLFHSIRGGDVPYPARIDANSRVSLTQSSSHLTQSSPHPHLILPQDLIAALLAADEAERLGCLCSEGISLIKSHAWFAEVDWGTVGATDANGELIGLGPYKPKKVRPSNLSGNAPIDPHL